VNEYLEEAAALLRKAAETNEKQHADTYSRTYLISGRERIAMKFAQLGAIQRGVLPPEMVQDLLVAVLRTEAHR
jgi:hypothetical protein